MKLTRIFDAQVERLAWGACAFSPDGQHIVSAIDSPEEHVIYTWNVTHGYAENTLQAGHDGVSALTWHPDALPSQLIALGRSGKMYVWAKVLTQDWSAFAPDFETLSDNREYVETETEFDVVVEELKQKQDVGVVQPPLVKAANENGGRSSVVNREDDGFNDDVIDIESWDWLGDRTASAVEDVWRRPSLRRDTSSADLIYLPVVVAAKVEENDTVICGGDEAVVEIDLKSDEGKEGEEEEGMMEVDGGDEMEVEVENGK